MPSARAKSRRKLNIPWLWLHTKSLSPWNCAIAQDGPIGACEMYGLVYDASRVLVARDCASASAFSLMTRCSTACALSHAWMSCGSGSASFHDAARRRARWAEIATSSRSAITPTKAPSLTTATTPGIALTVPSSSDVSAAKPWRANHTTVEHSRRSHVLDESGPAGDFVGQIKPWRRLSDQAIVARRFQRQRLVNLTVEQRVVSTFPETGAAPYCLDGAVLDPQIRGRYPQTRRGAL